MSGCADVTSSAMSRDQGHPHLLRDDIGIFVEAKADDDIEKKEDLYNRCSRSVSELQLPQTSSGGSSLGVRHAAC